MSDKENTVKLGLEIGLVWRPARAVGWINI